MLISISASARVFTHVGTCLFCKNKIHYRILRNLISWQQQFPKFLKRMCPVAPQPAFSLSYGNFFRRSGLGCLVDPDLLMVGWVSADRSLAAQRAPDILYITQQLYTLSSFTKIRLFVSSEIQHCMANSSTGPPGFDDTHSILNLWN